MTTATNTKLDRAASHIDAVSLGDGMWAHYAEETGSWHVVDSSDLESLCDYLDSDDPAIASDAYSHWCAGTSSDEMPSGWKPEDGLADTTPFDVGTLTFSCDAPEVDLDAGDDASYPKTTVTVSMPDASGHDDTVLCECDVWVYVGWLPPGASQDLDGSGLAQWGSSQPGGWRQRPGDGDTMGWMDLVHEIVEALRKIGKTVTKEAVIAEVSRWDFGDAEEPVLEDIWRVIDEIDGYGDHIRAGKVLGSPVIAWKGEREGFVVDPTERDVERALRDTTEALYDDLWGEIRSRVSVWSEDSLWTDEDS